MTEGEPRQVNGAGVEFRHYCVDRAGIDRVTPAEFFKIFPEGTGVVNESIAIYARNIDNAVRKIEEKRPVAIVANRI